MKLIRDLIYKKAKLALIAFILLDIHDVIDEVDILKKHKWEIKRLQSYSNANYLLTNKNDKFIVRLPHHDTHLFCDPAIEQKHALLAYSLSLNPIKPVYSDIKKAVVISRYIENAKIANPSDFLDQKTIKKVVKSIKKLHNSKLAFSKKTSPFHRMEVINSELKKKNLPLPQELQELFTKFIAVKDMLKSLKTKYVPCHNDLTPSNIIIYSDTVQFIDWEFSGMDDPVWDIASLIVFGELSPEKEALFLKLYGCKKIPYFFEKLKIYKSLITFNSCIWAYYKYVSKDYVLPKETLHNIYINLLPECIRQVKNQNL